MSRSSHLPARILEVYIEAFNHLISPDGLKPYYLNVMFLKQLLALEEKARCTFQGQGAISLQLPGSSSQVNWWSCPQDELLQQCHDRPIRKIF